MDKKSQLEVWAAKRVKAWGKPQPDDYDFRIWTPGASTKLLEAGCIYEYARESSKLRGLLLLIDDAQKRSDLGYSSYEGLRQEHVVHRIGSAVYWLADFADRLADNVSFAELVRTSRESVEQSLVQQPLRFPLTAILFAPPSPDEERMPWPWKPWSQFYPEALKSVAAGEDIRMPERQLSAYGSEKIAIEIRWADFTDTQIAREMKRFVESWRPQNENCKAPTQERRPRAIIGSHLKDLSVMRIWKRESKTWDRLRSVAKICRYKACVSESAEYETRRRNWRPKESMAPAAKTEMSKARTRALEYFQSLFPGEQPSNCPVKTRHRS